MDGWLYGLLVQMEAMYREEMDRIKTLERLHAQMGEACRKELLRIKTVEQQYAQELVTLKRQLEEEAAQRRMQVQALHRHVVDEVTTAVQVGFHDDKEELKTDLLQRLRAMDLPLSGRCDLLHERVDNSKSHEGAKLKAASQHICIPGQQFLRLSSRLGSYRALHDWLSRFMDIKSINLFYKSSRDGFKYPTFLDKTHGISRLLLLMRDGPTHLLACTVDGPLAEGKKTRCLVSFYAITGPYDSPTKITTPADGGGQRQYLPYVALAGREELRGGDGQPIAHVSIGVEHGPAVWLGYTQPDPAADLTSCYMRATRLSLPDGY
mmetsp:Transcript_39133/g.111816  ORF Transcript_39133/g.111816 Transcript_39133/m.111816 type:complete len:322 (+) Transcript_39133:15-980(+)